MPKKNAARLSDVVAEVLRLATAIRKYWAAELPRVHPDYPMIRPNDPVEKPPKEEKQLNSYLKDQSADNVYRLALIMYLGRGDFDVDDLAGQYEKLKDNFENPEAVIVQMTEKAPLADYIMEGVGELKRNRLDINNLLQPSASRN
jgi:hypothetical protein